MRLWHKDLIEVLPRQQLLGQWRECCLIAKNIVEKGSPNHILVNRIMDYDIEHFKIYTRFVYAEMIKRGYKANIFKFTKYLFGWDPLSVQEVFAGWHNNRYLIQCYYNLQEKYDCGSITDEEWSKIENRVIELTRIDTHE